MVLTAVPRDEAEDADAQAVSRIESATGATSEGTKTRKPKDEPQPIRAKRPKLPALPPNLADPVMEFPATLRLVSFGKSVKNVTATLNFDVPIPQDFRDVLGEHGFTVGFLGGWMGEGVQIKKVPLVVDVENRQVQKMSVQIPRFLDSRTDQLLAMIAPLMGGKALVERLFECAWPWRLNVPVDIAGQISLYAMQQSLALTNRESDEPEPGDSDLSTEDPD